MKHVRTIALAVTAIIGVAIITTVAAQDGGGSTANVEVRVWQSTNDAESLYISARPEGGSWATLGTIPLDMSGLNSRETYRYGDITVGVDLPGISPPPQPATETDTPSGEPAPPPDPTPEPEPFTVNVEVRVWQSTADNQSLYISARQEDGDWGVLGTIPLDMSGLNGRGTYRYGDIAIGVEVDVPWEDDASEPEQEEDSTPWVDPRPDNTYSLQELAALPAPAEPTAPPKPRHIVTLAFSDERGLFGVSLISDPSRLQVLINHVYDGITYPLLCTAEDSLQVFFGQVRCRYSAEKPFNSTGTDYLSFNRALTYSRPERGDRIEFSSATLDNQVLTCDGRGHDRYDRPFWWCYDSDVYGAWEEARDRALEPATDPLERYLRVEGDPPLWRQASPYEGEGPYTTGVFEPQPYVTYTISRIDMPGTSLNGALICAPYQESEGVIHLDTNDLSPIALWLLGPVLTDKQFFVRERVLCELEIENEGEWGFTVSESE